MSVLSKPLDPLNDPAVLQQIDRMGVTGDAPPVGFLDNFVPATALGLPRGLLEAGATIDTVGNRFNQGVINNLKPMLPRGAQSALRFAELENADEKEQIDTALQKVEHDFRPDPLTTGAAGQISNELTAILPRTIAAAPTGPLGMALAAGTPAGVAESARLQADGIDEDNANKIGLLTGGVVGVGSILPGGGFVKGALLDTGVAALANVGLGVGQRYGTSKVLKDAGYDAMAAQYEAFDKVGMATDFGFSVLLSGAHHLTAPEIDATLTNNNADKLTRGDGLLATDAKTGNAIDGAKSDAIRSVLDGMPVNVASRVADANLMRDPFHIEPELPPEIHQAARAAVSEVDAYDATTDRIIGLERGARPDAKNPLSSATGNGQFIKSTWLAMLAKHRPGLIEGMDVAQILELRKDPDLSREMVTQLARDNGKQLEAAGIDPDPESLYLAHHFGAGGAAKLIGADQGALMDTLLSPTELAANPTYKGKTVAQVRARFERRAAANMGKPRAPFEPAAAHAAAQTEIAGAVDLPDSVRAGLAAQYEIAARIKPEFDAAVHEIADAIGTPLDPMIPNVLKGVPRAAAKVVSDYDGDASRLKDIVRATVVIPSIGDAAATVAAIQARFGDAATMKKMDLDPAMPAPREDGYRDISFNVKIEGQTVELQANVPQMLAAKKQAHRFYQEQTEIERKVESEGRLNTPQEGARIRELVASQREIYDAAWLEATSSRNSDSVNSRPDENPVDRNLRGSAPSQASTFQSASLESGISSNSANRVPGGNDSGKGISGSPSRDSVSQAQVTDKGKAAGPLDPAEFPITGKTVEVVTERGMRLEVTYAIVDAGELVTSHDNALKANPEFPAELQPRDRDRAASEQQVAKIANSINPDLLAESPKASDGAPIIGADKVVESGNARTIALRRAYAGGKADGYRAYLLENAERFGLDPAAIDGVESPVLVRVSESEYNRAEFARQANESTVAAMSVTEVARADAKRLPDLAQLVTDDAGQINGRASSSFVAAFMRDVVGVNEVGTMSAADGSLSQAGQARIRNAVFAKAYGDADLVAMLAEQTDTNVKNIMAGMLRASGPIAKLREMMGDGARDPSLDIVPDLVAAVRKFAQLRSDGLTVAQHRAQSDMFGNSGLSPKADDLLTVLGDNARAPKRIAEFLTRWVDLANALGDPRQADVFGAKPSGDTLVSKASSDTARANAEPTRSADMFGAGARRQTVETPAQPVLTSFDADGAPVYQPMADALAEIDAELQAAIKEADGFEAGATCYIRRGVG